LLKLLPSALPKSQLGGIAPLLPAAALAKFTPAVLGALPDPVPLSYRLRPAGSRSGRGGPPGAPPASERDLLGSLREIGRTVEQADEGEVPDRFVGQQ